jgi:hypothetical protein
MSAGFIGVLTKVNNLLSPLWGDGEVESVVYAVCRGIVILMKALV